MAAAATSGGTQIPLTPDPASAQRVVRRKLGKGLKKGAPAYSVDFPKRVLFIDQPDKGGFYMVGDSNDETFDVRVGVEEEGWYKTKAEMEKALAERGVGGDVEAEEEGEASGDSDSDSDTEKLAPGTGLKEKAQLLIDLGKEFKKLLDKPGSLLKEIPDSKSGRALKGLTTVAKRLDSLAALFPPAKAITKPIAKVLGAVQTLRDGIKTYELLKSGESAPLLLLQGVKSVLDGADPKTEEELDIVTKAQAFVEELEGVLDKFLNAGEAAETEEEEDFNPRGALV
jgi:hypothetical protein